MLLKWLGYRQAPGSAGPRERGNENKLRFHTRGVSFPAIAPFFEILGVPRSAAPVLRLDICSLKGESFHELCGPELCADPRSSSDILLGRTTHDHGSLGLVLLLVFFRVELSP